jgi:hypothetical protein
MVGIWIVPLVISPIINNIKLRHILVDGGANLKVLSMYAFNKMYILHAKFIDMHPFRENILWSDASD